MPEALNPESADPGAKVRSMKVPLTQMIDLMLTVLLASLCKEEGVGVSQAFNRPFSFQVIKAAWVDMEGGWGESSPCLPARASQVSG